jgi:hypothetical protein
MMRKISALLVVFMILFTIGCSDPQAAKSNAEQSQPDRRNYQDEMYKTSLSAEGQIQIVKHPQAADLSFIHAEGLQKLPEYNAKSKQNWQVDLRSTDVSGIELEGRLDDLMYADFDSRTVWPEKLPDGYDPEKLMEIGKNPGLGLRQLHTTGITGKGVGLAILDQTLLVDHVEYKDQLKMYEEIHNRIGPAAMHGPAVASIAVGKTVGVAPGADLYYIAESHENNHIMDLVWMAESIDRIVKVNKMLPEGSKIRVISISLGINDKLKGYDKVSEAINAAKEEGIYTVYVESDPYIGLGREPLDDPEDAASYGKGIFWKNSLLTDVGLLVPMDSRCTASPTGENDYVFYRTGGMSWSVPYVAGLYALACQVKPDITPEIFWKATMQTGTPFSDNSGNVKTVGKIVNPAALIESLSP